MKNVYDECFWAYVPKRKNAWLILYMEYIRTFIMSVNYIAMYINAKNHAKYPIWNNEKTLWEKCIMSVVELLRLEKKSIGETENGETE